MAVYLDYNATTPVDRDVQCIIASVLENDWGNPSSSYSIGKKAKEIVETAREQVAGMIGAVPEEIVFTSGGTESNNMVIHSILRDYKLQQSSENGVHENGFSYDVPHIITTNIEHDAIRLPLEALSNEEKACVTVVPVSKVTGTVDVSDIIAEIRPNTRLITVMLANNETGVIQPVALIRDYVRSLKRNPHQQIYIHTDAAQAIGKIDVSVQSLGVDYLTIVGHKFYGPRIGALYFRKSCPLYHMFFGGGQERGFRPGTENTCMIAGLGLASHLVTCHRYEYNFHMSQIRNYLEDALKKEFGEKVIFNAFPDSARLPNTLSVAFDYNISGRELLNQVTDVFASTGAACHSGGKASAVLIASGVDEITASKTIRLSVGRETTTTDIDKAVLCLKNALLSIT